MRIVAIIQARMKSNRLPGKVMLDICGKTMLERVVERVRRAKTIQETVIATTTDPSDDGVAAFCQEKGYSCFRGSLYDVLDRFYQAARHFQAEAVVRITADCPLIDPDEIDHTVNEFVRSGVDFAANRLPPPFTRTYPIGLDTEVCTFQGLERAWKEAQQPYEREHVMPYFYDQEGRFRILRIEYEKDYGHTRWTVDTAEDLELIRRIYENFTCRSDFTWLDVLRFVERNPEITQVNKQVVHKTFLDVDTQRSKG